MISPAVTFAIGLVVGTLIEALWAYHTIYKPLMAEIKYLRILMSDAVLDDWFCQDNDEWLAKWRAALEES